MIKQISALIVLAAAVAPVSAANLLVNGDFQTGVLTPSTTVYTLSGTMVPETTWNIVGFDTLHPQWVDFADHTTGDSETGKYMIVNGTTDGVGPSWAQTVDVSSFTAYSLSGWFASLFPTAIASVQFRIYDVTPVVETESNAVGPNLLASGNFSAPTDLATWEFRSFGFETGSASKISVEIWDTNDAQTGNDYAIDDLSLQARAVPEPTGLIALAPLGMLMGRRRRA